MNTKLIFANVFVALGVVCSSLTTVVNAETNEQDALGQSAPTKLMIKNESDALVPKDLFGAKGGYFHPFISATALSSDNILNSSDKISDWLTIYSPGIWIAAPARPEIFFNLSTRNTSPGGRYQEIDKMKSFSRYQTYAMYVADINTYHNHSDMDNLKQSAEGFFQINLKGGLSIDTFDKYMNSHDPLGTRTGTVLDKFKSNLFGVIADYNLTDKFKLRMDYNNFDLNYDISVNEGRDRTDNAISGYLYYKYSTKTSFFVQYEFIDLAYKINTGHDNKQHYSYVGMDWRPTGKTTLKGKAGAVVRNSITDAWDITEPAMELTADYQVTGKTTAQLFVAQKIDESNVSTADYSVDRTINAAITSRFTDKIGARLQFGYTRSDFEGGVIDREDDIFTVSLVGTYALKKWLKAELGTQHTKRDSTQSIYDYNTNQIFVRLAAGI